MFLTEYFVISLHYTGGTQKGPDGPTEAQNRTDCFSREPKEIRNTFQRGGGDHITREVTQEIGSLCCTVK